MCGRASIWAAVKELGCSPQSVCEHMKKKLWDLRGVFSPEVAEEVQEIFYGADMPDEYRSEVLNAYLVQIAEMPLWQQVLIGVCIVTVMEFFTGCIVNLWLSLDVWDYNGLPGNVMGQICPQYCLLWAPASFAGMVLDALVVWGGKVPI